MVSQPSHLVELKALFLYETAGVYHVRIGGREYELPRQRVTLESIESNDMCVFTMPEWVAIDLEICDHVVR